MTIKVTCSKCGQSYDADERRSGETINCARCGEPIKIQRKEVMAEYDKKSLSLMIYAIGGMALAIGIAGTFTAAFGTTGDIRSAGPGALLLTIALILFGIYLEIKKLVAKQK